MRRSVSRLLTYTTDRTGRRIDWWSVCRLVGYGVTEDEAREDYAIRRRSARGVRARARSDRGAGAYEELADRGARGRLALRTAGTGDADPTEGAGEAEAVTISSP